MLNGLLGRGFASKCKTLIKLTKTQINVVQRKRNATQKFLKKDIANLLTNGLDINAYGRADGLTAELYRNKDSDENLITGSIPHELGKLKTVTHMEIGYNYYHENISVQGAVN
ncbi:hypothetical protein ACFX2I_007746 [Malus domestica]